VVGEHSATVPIKPSVRCGLAERTQVPEEGASP
jgi:hypothetical protein